MFCVMLLKMKVVSDEDICTVTPQKALCSVYAYPLSKRLQNCNLTHVLLLGIYFIFQRHMPSSPQIPSKSSRSFYSISRYTHERERIATNSKIVYFIYKMNWIYIKVYSFNSQYARFFPRTDSQWTLVSYMMMSVCAVAPAPCMSVMSCIFVTCTTLESDLSQSFSQTESSVMCILWRYRRQHQNITATVISVKL